jgi:gamma-glutamyl:cysteine ligase YbdK (ATP-grasp superfamily)
MARSIDRDVFDDDDYTAFSHRMSASLPALRSLLARPGFGEGPPSLGAEVELSLVDGAARPLGINRTILAASADRRLAPELDAFNVEYNLTPVPATGRPFTAFENELATAIQMVDTLAAPHGGRAASVGILPTLTEADLQSEALTDMPRYHALSAGVRRLRRAPFNLRIDGADPLTLSCPDITLEGANTSFQLHWRVTPADFASCYNAAQLATPLALAVGCNSPLFLGHRLWDETRIALFKQALDSRMADDGRWRAPARVGFGHGWVREGAWELFAEAVALFQPLFPLSGSEDSSAIVAAGGVPQLEELRLHMGTVWRWNRAIYDPALGGHLRIEMRALPSGPTPTDMVASAAFLIGLARALSDRVGTLLSAFPFAWAEYNFYRAARFGLDARVLWPAPSGGSPVEHAARDLATEMLPLAAEGLGKLGVSGDEIHRLLGVVRDRLASRTTGAGWQRRAIARLLPQRDPIEGLSLMMQEYLANAATGRPVHEWPEG